MSDLVMHPVSELFEVFDCARITEIRILYFYFFSRVSETCTQSNSSNTPDWHVFHRQGEPDTRAPSASNGYGAGGRSEAVK